MKAKLTKARRLAHYKKVLSWYEVTNNNDGLCIKFGDICWGDFMKCPFGGWKTLGEYYPEIVKHPTPICNYSIQAKRQRLKILRSAIAELSPKLNSNE